MKVILSCNLKNDMQKKEAVFSLAKDLLACKSPMWLLTWGFIYWRSVKGVTFILKHKCEVTMK